MHDETTTGRNEDDQLLAQLREAFGYDEAPSPETIEMIMTGYDIVNIDAALAELVHDSAVDGAPVAVRGVDLGARMVTFASQEMRFDFEIGDAEPQIVGKLTPATEGTIALDQPGNEQQQALDEYATFEFSLLPGVPYRLRFNPVSGRSIATDWLLYYPPE